MAKTILLGKIPRPPRSVIVVAAVAWALWFVVYPAAEFVVAHRVDNRDHRTVALLCRVFPPLANATDEYGDSVLNLAAERRDTEMVAILVERGADMTYEHGRAGNAAQQAAYYGDLSTLLVLLDAGIDVEFQVKHASSSFRGTLLYSAARGGHPNCVEVLLAHGADPNAPTPLRSGETPIWAAVEREPSNRDRLTCLRLLLDAGADPCVEVRSTTLFAHCTELAERAPVIAPLRDELARRGHRCRE